MLRSLLLSFRLRSDYECNSHDREFVDKKITLEIIIQWLMRVEDIRWFYFPIFFVLLIWARMNRVTTIRARILASIIFFSFLCNNWGSNRGKKDLERRLITTEDLEGWMGSLIRAPCAPQNEMYCDEKIDFLKFRGMNCILVMLNQINILIISDLSTELTQLRIECDNMGRSLVHILNTKCLLIDFQMSCSTWPMGS